MMRIATILLFALPFTGCGSDVPRTDVGAQTELPSTAEVRSSDGVPIRYDVLGTGNPAIVLVHGWTNPRRIWGEHPRTLASTHLVVNIDLAGHGESGVDRTEWTMDAFGEDVLAVVDALDLEEVVLVGFSLGAGVVLEAAKRLTHRVLGVVLVDAFHDPDSPPSAARREQMEAQFRAAYGDTAFLRAFGFTPETPDSLVMHVSEMYPPEPPEHWFHIFHAAGEWMSAELRPTLQRLEVPVAAINTTRMPTNVDAMRRYAPSFTVDTIDGVGHAGILLQRVADFDARLRALIERFEETA